GEPEEHFPQFTTTRHGAGCKLSYARCREQNPPLCNGGLDPQRHLALLIRDADRSSRLAKRSQLAVVPRHPHESRGGSAAVPEGSELRLLRSLQGPRPEPRRVEGCRPGRMGHIRCIL